MRASASLALVATLGSLFAAGCASGSAAVKSAARCDGRVSPSSNANGVLWSPRGVSRAPADVAGFSPCRPYLPLHMRGANGFAAPNGWTGTYRTATIRYANGEQLVIRGLGKGWKTDAVAVSPKDPHVVFASTESPLTGEDCLFGNGIAYRVTPTQTSSVLRYNPCKVTPRVAWSPDGTHMSYVNGPDEALYIADSYGRAAAELTRGVGNYLWSPDGSRIAYAVANASSSRVAVVDIATGHSRTLAAGTLGAWSPDGKEIAVVSGSKLLRVPAALG